MIFPLRICDFCTQCSSWTFQGLSNAFPLCFPMLSIPESKARFTFQLQVSPVSYLKELIPVLYPTPLGLHSRWGPYPSWGTREKWSLCSECHEHRKLMTWHSRSESSIIKNQSSLPKELAPGKHNSLTLPRNWKALVPFGGTVFVLISTLIHLPFRSIFQIPRKYHLIYSL